MSIKEKRRDLSLKRLKALCKVFDKIDDENMLDTVESVAPTLEMSAQLFLKHYNAKESFRESFDCRDTYDGAVENLQQKYLLELELKHSRSFDNLSPNFSECLDDLQKDLYENMPCRFTTKTLQHGLKISTQGKVGVLTFEWKFGRKVEPHKRSHEM